MSRTLSDTPGRGEGESARQRRVRAGDVNWRLVTPLGGAAVCLIAAGLVPPLIGYVLVIAAFGCVLDGATYMYPKGDNLTKYKQ